jgi:hypothetical protein
MVQVKEFVLWGIDFKVHSGEGGGTYKGYEWGTWGGPCVGFLGNIY